MVYDKIFYDICTILISSGCAMGMFTFGVPTKRIWKWMEF